MSNIPPAITTPSFGGHLVPPDVVARIITTIVGGSPFAASLSRLPTGRTSVAFPVLTDADDPSWVAEMGIIPTLGLDTDAYVVATSKLAGTVLISLEAVDDATFNVSQQTEQILRDTFSAKLDRDLVSGDGQGATPAGVTSIAPEVAGPDLWGAVAAAKGEIANAGGAPSHLALNPTAAAAEEGQRDGLGRPLYPDGLQTFAGLTVVRGLAATVPLVYDSSRCWLIVRRDFQADLSRDYAPAFERYAVALRLVGRFGLAIPTVINSVRKLDVAEGPSSLAVAATPEAGSARRR